MADKSSDWQPGPNVCRCCFAEGCYKDISTEYFWMGKKEVYSDMLLDTFDISIGYSKTQGPNSNSRLICEPCISRLRDATDFKRQVQECERTFMQHLDPGRSSTVEVPLEQHKGEIKLERVKIEEEKSDDDFDAPFDEPFGDDDDDDLDDQPLTKLATKIPKKESEDLLRNLLVKAEKRKAPLKVKVVPAKKVKKKDEPQPTASKAKPVEKKKKGVLARSRNVTATNEDLKKPTTTIQITKSASKKDARHNAAVIIENSNATPFKVVGGVFTCFNCSKPCPEFSTLRTHVLTHSNKLQCFVSSRLTSIKIDITDLQCNICSETMDSIDYLRTHLVSEHQKDILEEHDLGVIPFKITTGILSCVICNEQYETYRTLNIHMDSHYPGIVCPECGKALKAASFSNHLKTHRENKTGVRCSGCHLYFPNKQMRDEHFSTKHRFTYKCPHCTEGFKSYWSRTVHIRNVHNISVDYSCRFCAEKFNSCNKRTLHISRVHTATKFVCDMCAREFYTKSDLNRHVKRSCGKRN